MNRVDSLIHNRLDRIRDIDDQIDLYYHFFYSSQFLKYISQIESQLNIFILILILKRRRIIK